MMLPLLPALEKTCKRERKKNKKRRRKKKKEYIDEKIKVNIYYTYSFMLRAIIPDEDAEFLWSSNAVAAIRIMKNIINKIFAN